MDCVSKAIMGRLVPRRSGPANWYRHVCLIKFMVSLRHPDSINKGKVANLTKGTGSVHCTKILGHISIIWTSFFDTDLNEVD